MPELAHHPAYALLLDHLRQQIGLDPMSACAGKVPSALADLGVADEKKLTAYVLAAQRQPLLLHELIRLIVVHETWFFREPAAFEVLVQAGLETAAAGRRFKVLSAPCSTGEEPCSIALALIEAGVPRELIDILALDISGEAVQQARRGIFAEMAFRGTTREWRDARFVRDGQRWRLRARLDDVIRFETANLMALPAHIVNERFDAVFCRNLLIYLDTSARRQLFTTLRALARPDTGLIFVGHAESTNAFQGELVRMALPMSFGFHNRPSGPRPAWPAKGLPVVPRSAPPRLRETGVRVAAMIAPVRASTSPAPATPTTPPTSYARPAIHPLRDVRLLADRGEIDHAVTMCEQVILSHPDLADARCYRGMLAAAAGQAHMARACFTKALYLDPRHADSLHHLMLLAQGEGDAMGAQRYRERLQRLQAPAASDATEMSSREVRS